MPPRLSQRQSLACRECTKAKRKCNKEIPCERCTRLGLSCEREAVYLKKNLRRNNDEIRYLEDLKRNLQTSGDTKLAVESIAARIDHLRFGHVSHAPNETTPETVCDSLEKFTPAESMPKVLPSVQGNDTVTALEHMAWGRNHGGCFPHRHCNCQYRQQPTSTFNLESLQSIFATLPDQNSARILVFFHTDHIAWHHNAINCPGFLRQCEIFWETGQYEHPQWISLYFAILSTSLMCLQNSWKYHETYPISLAQYSPLALFQAMVDLLYASNFLGDITLYSIQAIVISTEVAHNLGLSQLNATLFNAAIRMAECLGLHKIEDNDESDFDESSQTAQDALEREIGRRIWLQMIIQDHFAIPFTDSYGIHPSRYSTSVPRNADDSSIWKAAPDEVPTTSTYNRVLGKIALLMPELFDGMGSLKDPKSLEEQYRHVLDIDSKMRQTVRTIPHFLLRQDTSLEKQHSWLPCARQSLAITAAEKIIMIHRPFIFQSFQSPIYSSTRRTCTAAAITILREQKNISDYGALSLWTHIAFCITAAVILSFEVMCNQESNGQDTSESYVDLVRGARRLLSQRVNDTLAHRGVVLLDAIFSAAGCIEPISETTEIPDLASVNFEDIVVRFTRDLGALGIAPQPGPWEVSCSGMEQATQGDNLEDFNDWFNRTFHGLD